MTPGILEEDSSEHKEEIPSLIHSLRTEADVKNNIESLPKNHSRRIKCASTG